MEQLKTHYIFIPTGHIILKRLIKWLTFGPICQRMNEINPSKKEDNYYEDEIKLIQMPWILLNPTKIMEQSKHNFNSR